MANTPVFYKYPTKPWVPTIKDKTKNVQYIVRAYRLPIPEQATTKDLAYRGDMVLPFLFAIGAKRWLFQF